MKNILFIIALCCTVFFQSCDSSGNRPENKTSVDQVDPGQRQSSNLNDAGLDGGAGEGNGYSDEMAYICPMKCEGSASDKPGKCPVCKMDLVKNPQYREGTSDRANEVLNHESEPADDKNYDDKIEGQSTK